MEATREYPYPSAAHYADHKVRLTGEILKYCLVTGFLLILFRPIGVLVGFIWGIKLFKRSFQSWMAPPLRDRFMQQELERREARPRRSKRERRERIPYALRGTRQEKPTARHAAGLVNELGEANSRDNLVYARRALAELEQSDRPEQQRKPQLQIREMSMGRVVEDMVGVLGSDFVERGIRLTIEVDSAGVMQGDPTKLRGVIFDLLRAQVGELDDAKVKSPHVTIQSGENLAGSEVWVRLRHNSPSASADDERLEGARRWITAHGGSFEVQRDGNESEFLLTFDKARGEQA